MVIFDCMPILTIDQHFSVHIQLLGEEEMLDVDKYFRRKRRTDEYKHQPTN